jgi:hypothetical protein
MNQNPKALPFSFLKPPHLYRNINLTNLHHRFSEVLAKGTYPQTTKRPPLLRMLPILLPLSGKQYDSFHAHQVVYKHQNPASKSMPSLETQNP